MSRRRIVLLAGVAIPATIGLALVVAPYFSPIPGLVAEVNECLEPATEAPGQPEVHPGHDEAIEIEFQFAGFNTTRAGTALLAADGAGLGGLVKDRTRLRTTLDELQSEGCVAVRTNPRVVTVTGKPASFEAGGELVLISLVNGKEVVDRKRYGTKVRATPTLCTDGRMHMDLELTQTDLRQGSPVNKPEFDVVAARTSVIMQPGQTCFIGGITHRCKGDQGYQDPSAGALLAIGSWFRSRNQAEIDEELLLLATPKRVTRSSTPADAPAPPRPIPVTPKILNLP